MKHFLFLVTFFLTTYSVFSQHTTIPIVTSDQRNTISNPTNGFLVFESTSEAYFLYSNSCNCWQKLPNKTSEGNNHYSIAIKTDSADGNEIIKIGTSEGFTSFEKDGSLILNETATVFEDLTIPVTSSKLHGSNPPTFDIVKNDGNDSFGVFTYWFDFDNNEELFFTVQIPHKRKINSDLYPHVHWIAPTNLDEKKVKWSMEYTAANVGDFYENTKTISSSEIHEAIKTQGAYQHLITDLGKINGSNIDLSNMLICRVYRDADSEADNYEEEAGLLQIDFHYEIDALGSRDEYKK